MRRDAYYTNISPGSYRFSVIACNNDGLWSETGASFNFTLMPFFYQRKLFYALMGLMVLLAGFGIHQRRIHRFRTRERELTALVEARTEDLAELNWKLADVNKNLVHLATYDSLTGIANHRLFMNTLEIEWQRSERQSLPLSLIMADVDDFKAFNERYGHLAGDQCLKVLATSMAESLTRAGDLVARYGGEEFIVLLPATDVEDAALVAERLRRRIEEAETKPESSSACLYVTISLGVAGGIAKRGMLAETLIQASDQALYQAKNGGGNRIVIAPRQDA
jgi:diguanylate cyclase (GGDEF)-like protein